MLQALQAAAADSLEDCILECPAGLQALVEVLRDPREEVRNEVILLLGQVRLRTPSAPGLFTGKTLFFFFPLVLFFDVRSRVLYHVPIKWRIYMSPFGCFVSGAADVKQPGGEEIRGVSRGL